MSAARQRGSVLMLMPAAILIVLVLGGVAIDSATAFLRQRQAYNVAFDAANDAVSSGIDLATARSTGAYVYDPARIDDIARMTVVATGVEHIALIDATTDGTAVIVTVSYEVPRLFAQAFGGNSREVRHITARVDAVVVTG